MEDGKAATAGGLTSGMNSPAIVAGSHMVPDAGEGGME